MRFKPRFLYRPILLQVMVTLAAGNAVATAAELHYSYSMPPLEVHFTVLGGHYSGKVDDGNLFIDRDIQKAPLVKWKNAVKNKWYTLMMIDLDGNAEGSWPDHVPIGTNAPVRHWIVGNISGELLSKEGYLEGHHDPLMAKTQILESYRYPHIPEVSDRYGVFLFEQEKQISFPPLSGPVTNFPYKEFLKTNGLKDPVASNWFVAIHTSESPFSGKAFHGNDVSGTWDKTLGKGVLPPSDR